MVTRTPPPGKTPENPLYVRQVVPPIEMPPLPGFTAAERWGSPHPPSGAATPSPAADPPWAARLTAGFDRLSESVNRLADRSDDRVGYPVTGRDGYDPLALIALGLAFLAIIGMVWLVASFGKTLVEVAPVKEVTVKEVVKEVIVKHEVVHKGELKVEHKVVPPPPAAVLVPIPVPVPQPCARVRYWNGYGWSFGCG